MHETPHFDDILKLIGEFGCWQKFLYFSSCCLVIVPSAIQMATIVFATGTPNFHCVTANVTCEQDKCCDSCTDYSFDGPFASTVSEWNLICASAHVGAVTQAIFVVGMMVGSLVFGFISDMFGRKFCLFLCSVLTVAFSVGSSFVDCLSFFTFLRFCAGATVTGLFVGHYVYILELVGPNYRTLAGKVQDVFWVLGASIVALAAYLIRDWRYLLLFSSIPPGLLFSLWRVFPESVRWLVAHGNLKKAHGILMTYAEKSSAKVDTKQIMEMLKMCKKTEGEGGHVVRHSPLDLIRTSRMRKRTFILCFNWMDLSLVFYGIMLYIPRLDGNIYLNFFLMFLIDLLHTPLAWTVFKQFGRRVPHCVFMCISGVSCLLVLAVPEDKKSVITALAFIGRFFGSASFSNIYLYSSELYPTVVRNLALGTCSTSARIGGIIAPFVVMLAQLPGITVTLPLVIMGVLTLIAGFLSLWLPETLSSNMHQTVEELERARESYGIVCMTKPRPCPIPWMRCGNQESPGKEPCVQYPLSVMDREDPLEDFHPSDPI